MNPRRAKSTTNSNDLRICPYHTRAIKKFE